MENRSRVLLGAAMIVVGLMSLACMGMGALLGLNPLSFVWRLWPLLVIGVGLLFLAPPILVRASKGWVRCSSPGCPS